MEQLRELVCDPTFAALQAALEDYEIDAAKIVSIQQLPTDVNLGLAVMKYHVLYRVPAGAG
jgi:hypothetical protein